MKVVEQTGQLWTQAILPVAVGRREERDHIKGELPLTISQEPKLSLSVVAFGHEFSLITCPFVSETLAGKCC